MLMNLAYRVVTVLLLAPLMTPLAVILSGDLALLLPIYTHTFMPALANYAMAFLPTFLLGALFGQLMADSGAAHALSARIVRVVGQRHAVRWSWPTVRADRWRRLAVRGRVRGHPIAEDLFCTA